MAKIPKYLARPVRERAKYRCEYCPISEWLSGQLCHIDHIIPRKLGGATTLENLCLACAACNGSKLDRIEAIDPESSEIVALFHPRTQQWSDHFAWSDDGTLILGRTACGRVTIAVLKLNRPLAVRARGHWVSVNRHPPRD
jgi:hypothetical protein